MTDGTAGGRDELRGRLRALLKASGTSTTRAAEDLNARGVSASQSKVSRTITGRVAADPEFVGHLVSLLGATRDERAELVALAKEIRKGNRRLVLGRDKAAAASRVGKFARESALVRAVALTSMPAELQTEPYLREVFVDEPAVRQRRLNQDVLDDETSPRRFVFLIFEGAFGSTPLSPSRMATQVDEIAAALDRRNVRIGIIPWGAQLPRVPQHSWYLYDSRLLVTGGLTYALDLTDPEDVASYVALTDELEQIAVFDRVEARAILARVADRYRSP